MSVAPAPGDDGFCSVLVVLPLSCCPILSLVVVVECGVGFPSFWPEPARALSWLLVLVIDA